MTRLAAVGCLCALFSACWVFDNPVDPLNAGTNSGGAPGTTPSASMDTTPPTVSGTVASSMSGPPDAVQLSWSAATDNSTSQSNLQYQVVYSTSAFTTLAQAQAATVAVGWTANMTTASVPVTTTGWDTAAGSFHYFDVLVKDLAGNESMYPVVQRKVELYDIVAVVGSASGSAAPGTYVFFNDGNGNFTQSQRLSVATSGYSNLALGNLTSHVAPSDGGPTIDDIFVTNNNVSPNEVWQNNGSGTFTQKSESWSTAPSTAVALGPIFGVAGEIDAFVANSNAASTVWQNTGGTGTFTAASEANLALSTTNASVAAAMGNITGSGGSAQDVFVGNNGQTNMVWEDLAGTGTYSACTESNLISSDYTSGAAVADLNGDGYPDVFVTNSGASGAGGQNYVYLNNSTGTLLGTPKAVGPANSNSTAVALGDLNSDGAIDAFVVNSGSPDTVWLNNGSGSFSQKTGTTFPTNQGTDVALGDLNGDGILDAVVSSGGASGTIQVWFGNGDGTFTQGPTLAPSGDYVAVAIGRLR